jgi:ATP-dependent DNA helicase DinG
MPHDRSPPPRSVFDSALADALGPGGKLSASMSGYEHRSAQLEMARAVEHALARDELLLCEAGTGTGKTLAYLLPAILSGRKVVISTGTKTLQDQILQHDLPLLERHLGLRPNVACMKGLNNYLCLRRYEELALGAAAFDSRAGVHLPLVQDWLAHTLSGDRAELDLPEDAAIWSEIHSGTDTRIGGKCRHYEPCFVTRMRARAQQAQLVIVNHHLFFADLALRGDHPGGAIPNYDAVIFDEAHLLEDVATDFFGVTVSSTKLATLARDAARTFAAAKLLSGAERLLSQLISTAGSFFACVPRAAGNEGGRTPLSAELIAERVQPPMFALDNALDGLSAHCMYHADRGEAVAQLARRCEQLRADLATLCEGGGKGRVCYTLARGKSVTIGASPVELGPMLRDRLFYRGIGIVLTSATLAVDGSFAFVRERLGIDLPAEERLLSSPFDYPSQAALYLPELPDPRAGSYFAAAAHEVEQLIALTGGGAFVLCTSHRMVRALGERLRPQLGPRLLVQGDAPNAALLERFRSDGNAVLVATAGFWQGVDVPGRALRLVIIDKLPFDVPSDPLIAARCERLEQQGIQPFMRYLVPSAALTLKQGFGRLIRGRSDRGIVAILDSRLTTKGYGKVLLRSLPPATRCRSFEQLTEFWTQTSGEARPGGPE